MVGVVKKDGQVPAQVVQNATGTKIEWLIDRHDGVPNFELRKFRIAPGGRIAKHYHPDIEHEQYVLKGNYVIGIGDKEYKVKPGDSLYISEGTVHWYENQGVEEAEFLCVVPKKQDYKAVYLEKIEP